MSKPKTQARKYTVSDFKAEVKRLQGAGKLPSLEEVLRAVAGTRAVYREKILAARRESELHVPEKPPQ